MIEVFNLVIKVNFEFVVS